MTTSPERRAETAPEAETDKGSLGTLARAGMFWSLLNSAAARILNIGAGFIIARIVLPDQMGTYAIAVLVLTIVLSMNEIGLSVAVIRWKGALDRITPTAVSGSFAASVFWFAVMFAGAPAIAALLNAPGATVPIQVLSLGVLLDGVSTIPGALMMRGFLQRRRAAAELLGFSVGMPVGILLATNSGAAGLAVGLLVSNAVTTAMILWLAPSRPRPGWDRETAVELLRLGFSPALTSMLLLAIINVDSVVVSRVLGVGALGFYALAFNIASWPLTLLSMSIRQVSLPAFSRLADDRVGLEEAFSRSLTLAAGLAVLGGVLLASLAAPVVGILYGDKWLPAVAALQWLAVLGAVRVILELSYDLLIAVGRGGALLRVQIGWLVALVVTLPLGAHLGGIGGVALAHAAVAAGLVLPLNIWLLVGSGLRLRSLAHALQPVVAASLAGAAVALLATQVDAPRGVTLAAAGALVTFTYGVTFFANRRGRTALRWARPPSLPDGGSAATVGA
jgi:O-antigen/teichoic acid export membrane protein